jgi:FlaG/FlaF family flagellin (archaellin)
MKGISTIVATIMIVIIVVALVSLTYTFAVGLFGTSTKPIETGVTETTKKIDQRVSFVVDPICTRPDGITWQISFSIRHEGSTYNITSDGITALFGNAPGDITGWGSNQMAPGTVKSLTFKNNSAVDWSGKTDSFTVSAPANPISVSVTCP